MWTKVGTIKKYTVWKNLDALGKAYYNVTADGMQPMNNSGYYDLVTLLILKSIPRYKAMKFAQKYN